MNSFWNVTIRLAFLIIFSNFIWWNELLMNYYQRIFLLLWHFVWFTKHFFTCRYFLLIWQITSTSFLFCWIDTKKWNWQNKYHGQSLAMTISIFWFIKKCEILIYFLIGNNCKMIIRIVHLQWIGNYLGYYLCSFHSRHKIF